MGLVMRAPCLGISWSDTSLDLVCGTPPGGGWVWYCNPLFMGGTYGTEEPKPPGDWAIAELAVSVGSNNPCPRGDWTLETDRRMVPHLLPIPSGGPISPSLAPNSSRYPMITAFAPRRGAP